MAAEFTVVILPDGALRIDMGDMSGPHHCDAEMFLAAAKDMMGGSVVVTDKSKNLQHVAKQVNPLTLKH